jgi:hypothetical protein
MRYYVCRILLAAVILLGLGCGSNVLIPAAMAQSAPPSVPMVGSNAELQRLAPSTAPIVGRAGYRNLGDAPTVFFKLASTPCTINSGLGDGMTQLRLLPLVAGKPVAAGCATLMPLPQGGNVDVRIFGAIPDNRTPADAAVAAAVDYAQTINGCVYLPNIAPGYTFNKEITLTKTANCLVGDRIQAIARSDRSGYDTVLHFPKDTNGIHCSGCSNDFHIANLSLVGNAQDSKSPTHTSGLFLDNVVEGKVENMFISNFVVCRKMQAPVARVALRDIYCNDQYAYPNIVNDFPYACEEFAPDSDGGSSVGAFQDTGGMCRAGAWNEQALASGDASTTSFSIEQNPLGIPLWRADGIKVRVGPPTILQNGQKEYNAPLKTCGIDYTIWDGGTQLFCAQVTGTIKAGSTTVTVPSTVGLDASLKIDNGLILAVADHGLPLATTLADVSGPTTLTLSKPATASGAVTLKLIQRDIKHYGGGSGGTNISIKFKTPPPAGSNNVELRWVDPTGYAAIDAEDVSDYIDIEPVHVGGYDVGLKHVGLSDGGITFKPTYVELLNQCADVEKTTYGDDVEFHRVINPPIPNCPGYVDPSGGPTVAVYNNVFNYYNGAAAIKH